jgi:hypothetical protein
MPPLISKWQQLPDNDKDLFPLLECFTSIAQVWLLYFNPAWQKPQLLLLLVIRILMALRTVILRHLASALLFRVTPKIYAVFYFELGMQMEPCDCCNSFLLGECHH